MFNTNKIELLRTYIVRFKLTLMLLIQYNLLFLLIKYFFHYQLIEQNLNIVVQSFVVFDRSRFQQVQNLYHMYLKKMNL